MSAKLIFISAKLQKGIDMLITPFYCSVTYLNIEDPYIPFTSEIESKNRPNFLDISVCKVDNKFTASV